MNSDFPARSVLQSADTSGADSDVDEQDIIEFSEFKPSEPQPRELESAGTEPVAPAWFKKLGTPVDRPNDEHRKPSKQPKRKRSRGGPKIDVAPEEEQNLTWQQKAVLWVMSMAAGCYGLSLLFHILVLGGFSLIIMTQLNDNQAISTVITETQGVDMDFEEILDTRIDAGLNDSKDTKLPQYQPLTTSDPATLMVNPAEILGSVTGDGDSDEDGGSQFVFKMPAGGKVVTKGSFTAWTVPEDPKPREAYQIIIQVTLPKKVRRYRSSDLSGRVIGTDDYTQEIPYDRRKPAAAKTTRKGRLVIVRQRDYLPLKERVAQLAITVPGAGILIKDTIVIESRILKEKQTLEIEF